MDFIEKMNKFPTKCECCGKKFRAGKSRKEPVECYNAPGTYALMWKFYCDGCAEKAPPVEDKPTVGTAKTLDQIAAGPAAAGIRRQGVTWGENK